jgi:hypothetical protein
MATNNNFWRGVLQNALGSILAGLVLLGLGKVWADAHFSRLINEIKSNVGQVASLQAQVDRLTEAMREKKGK